MKKFCAKDIAKVLDKTVTFGIETLRPHILRYVRLQLFYLGYWIPLFMISRNDQITFVVHCKVMCLNLCYKRFRKEKISLEQSNGFLEFRLARSTLLFAPFPVDLRRGGWGGWGVGGWSRKTWHCQDWIDSPSSWHTHLFDPLYPGIPDWLTKQLGYKLPFSLHDVGKSLIKKLR